MKDHNAHNPIMFIFSILLTVVCIVHPQPILAQESSISKNIQEINSNVFKNKWSARWITHPSISPNDYNVILFRKVFDLTEIPSDFIIHISADNRYRLFVNEKHITYGPEPGDLMNYKYESINIAGFLKLEKNCLAVEVVNFGVGKKIAQQSGQTSFLLQADGANEININTGETNWKVFQNESYTPIVFNSYDFGEDTYYAAGPGDNVNFVNYPWNWHTINFNDAGWYDAKETSFNQAVGRGYIFGGMWHLGKSTLPLMEEKTETTPSIRKVNSEIDDKIELNNDEHKIIVHKNSSVSILFDNITHTIGYPELIISKGKNSKIKITYSEALVYDKSKKLLTTNDKIFDKKGNRNDIEDKVITGVYDLITTDGGGKRLFRPLSKRTYRFIQLDIKTEDEALFINDFYGVNTRYPFDEKAKFITNDTLLNKIWENSWRTLRNSSGETFYDSPYYEQLQYIGDTKIASLVSIYISGDDRLMRNALVQFDHSRLSFGLTQSRYPSYIPQIIPTFSLIWINMIHDYMMYREDTEFIRQFVPGMKSVLDWFERKIDSTGMPTKLDWWNFIDWAEGYQFGIPPGADSGYSANVSLLYILALQNAVAVFNYSGNTIDAEHYSKIAMRVKKAVIEKCYDNSKNLFAETPEKEQFSQHTNIFAILTDVIKKADQKQMMTQILEDKSLIQTSIYFKFYLFKALQKAGLGDKYLSLLSPWENMIKDGMTTFGETDINPRSDCHAWSSSPCFDFLHIVAGIYPAEPGFKTVIIEPNLGSLNNIDVEFPHPNGMIKCIFNRNQDDLKGKIVLPPDLLGKLIWNKTEMLLKPGDNFF